MDYMETERIIARMAELQPRVPEWCKAEKMVYAVPQKELWHYGMNNHHFFILENIRHIFSRQKRREAAT